jgi:ADP-ribose pyrophosphatase YjhB (NUDIX family)
MTYIKNLRSKIGPRKIILAFASAIIRDARGRVLFQRRTDFEWWGLPGGVLEIGETLAQCAVREAREETGLEVEPTRLVGVYSGPRYDVRYPNGDEVQQWTAAFECRIWGGDGRADGDEASQQGFFAPEALPPTSIWYADMARDALAKRDAASFEPPRPNPPAVKGDYLQNLRRHVGQMELISPGAAAFIFNDAGHVLLIRRADNGQWGAPAGGMDIGESIAETVVRETREETGLIVEPVRLVGVHAGPEYRIVYPNGDPLQICSSLFECRIVGGELRPDGVEALDAAFFPPDALPSSLPDRIRKRLAEALRNLPYALYS